MRSGARAGFLPFLDRWEGNRRNMYLDEKGLVTTGHGNLLPLALALRLDWTRKIDGGGASELEVRQEWSRISAMQSMAGKGGGTFEKWALLHVTDASLEKLVDRELASIEATLAKDFPNYPDAPSDGQLPLVRLAWALGQYFAEHERWPKFHAAYVAGDFAAAAEESRMQEKGQPEEFRLANDAVQLLLRNAAIVISSGIDPEPLYWPAALACDEG